MLAVIVPLVGVIVVSLPSIVRLRELWLMKTWPRVSANILRSNYNYEEVNTVKVDVSYDFNGANYIIFDVETYRWFRSDFKAGEEMWIYVNPIAPAKCIAERSFLIDDLLYLILDFIDGVQASKG